MKLDGESACTVDLAPTGANWCWEVREALANLKGATGAIGPQGPKGDTGDKGDKGVDGTDGDENRLAFRRIRLHDTRQHHQHHPPIGRDHVGQVGCGKHETKQVENIPQPAFLR